MQRLLGLAPSCGIGRGEAYPVGPGHRRALTGFVVLASLLLGWSAWAYFVRSPGDLDLTVEGVNSSQVRLISDTGQSSVPLIDRQGTSRFSGIPANSRRKLWFLKGDYVSKEEVEIGRSSLRVFVEQRDFVLPCSESWPEKGVTALRCPEGTQGIIELPTWRESLGTRVPKGRLLSVAFDIRGDGKPHHRLDNLVDALLRFRSVDRVYRIHIAIGLDPKSTAVNAELKDIEPLLPDSQLVWWTVGAHGRAAAIRQIWPPVKVGRRARRWLGARDSRSL